MRDFGWDYPPGVTGNEPQIAGPEERTCPECAGAMFLMDEGMWRCEDCDHSEYEPDEYDYEPPEPDDELE